MIALPPQVRIIDNKKVWMTPDEYSLYEEICKGYDRPNFKGKELFQDHFETNDYGIILFVKPPHKKYSSMEVFTFLISVQVNQQLRIAQDQVISLVKESEERMKEFTSQLDDLKQTIKDMKVQVEQLGKRAVKANDDTN